jgi:hypothetical protein
LFIPSVSLFSGEDTSAVTETQPLIWRRMSQRVTLTPILLVLTAATVLNAPLSAQVSGDSRPPADPADVESVDAIITAVYDVISGPAGQQRDWDRMRSLFIPGARLIPTGRDSAGASVHRVMTLDQWIAGADRAFAQTGFFERELYRVAERYGNIVHLFSTYDSKRTPDGEPFARGINSFQLLYDGSRWWVVTIFWQGESPDHPIPAKYLPNR